MSVNLFALPEEIVLCALLLINFPRSIVNAFSDEIKEGAVIDTIVTFSANVASIGDVTVTLETGATDRTCTFTVTDSSSGTCDYIVQTGDTSSDLNVNTIAGMIADQEGNSMVDFVPVTNLAASAGIIIDTTAPSIPIAVPAGGTYGSTRYISLSSAGSSMIYYTIDGSPPTAASTGFFCPIALSSSATLSVFALDAAGNESTILTETYDLDGVIPDRLLGDVNNDGVITSTDADLIRQHVLGNALLTGIDLIYADADQNGIVARADSFLVLASADGIGCVSSLYGDINRDSIHNSPDITLLRRYIGGINPFVPFQRYIADVNVDGNITDTDVSLLRSAIGLVVTLPVLCGNGIVNDDWGASCDDGNTTGGDGCSAACIEEISPSISILSPEDNAIVTALTDNLTIQFDEIIGMTGTGYVSIYKASDDSIVEQINTASGSVTGSGSVTITINPTVTLANSTAYYVKIDTMTFPDKAGNFFTWISDSTTWNFTTVAAAGTPTTETPAASSSSGGGRGHDRKNPPRINSETRKVYPEIPLTLVTQSPLPSPPVSPFQLRVCRCVENRFSDLRILDRIKRRLYNRFGWECR